MAKGSSKGGGKKAVNPSTNNTADLFRQSLANTDIVERVRIQIKNAHVFKLPPRQSAGGWRGGDWKDKVWQGTVKVVERGEHTAAMLVDRLNGSIFAVCPIKEGAIDRCVDSSRYFVLRIENAQGKHMFIGVAFNERNDAFDFNTSLEDSRREREAELKTSTPFTGPKKDYSLKEGQKIHVAIPMPTGEDNVDVTSKIVSQKKGIRALFGRGNSRKSSKSANVGGFALAPSSKDTPRRTSKSDEQGNLFSDNFDNGFQESQDVSS